MARKIHALSLITALVAGCFASTPATLPETGGAKPPLPAAQLSDNTAGQQPASSDAPRPLAGVVYGAVLDEAGRPAAGVSVTAYRNGASPLIGNAGSGLVGNAGSGLAGNAGSGLIGNAGSGLAGGYRVQAVGTVKTDEQGRFRLTPDATGSLNLEAEMGDSSKAWKAELTYDSTASSMPAGTLNLAPTGTIAGRVTAPDAPAVTDFEGVDVFIPGSSYMAKTDKDGRYQISHVPAARFSLSAGKLGLGQAHVHDVTVYSLLTTAAPDLALWLKAPRIDRVSPANAGPGVEVLIEGEYFGATQGKSLEVSFNGSKALQPGRTSDKAIKAVVPVGATTGNLVVTVETIQSNGLIFNVLRTLSLFPGDLDLRLGTAASQSLTAFDTAEATISSPAVTWALQGQAAQLSGDGTARTVSASALGDATLLVSSGNASRSALVHVFEIKGVSLSPPSLQLNALPADGSSPDQSFVTRGQFVATVESSDGVSRRVRWSSSEPQIVSISDDGTVTAGASDKDGSAVVTATSIDDPGFGATASVQVTARGEMEVGVK